MRKTDPPETYEQYFWREVLPLIKNPDLTLEQMHEEYDDFYKPFWKEDEQVKSDYRKQLEREAKEHESTVEKLKIQIEKEKGRLRLEEMRQRERDVKGGVKGNHRGGVKGSQ
jgi:recombinational DNA repair ATPase RecF